MFVKPTNSLVKVIDPVRHQALPEEGYEVQESPYWSRRVRDGDVQVVSQKSSKILPKGE